MEKGRGIVPFHSYNILVNKKCHEDELDPRPLGKQG